MVSGPRASACLRGSQFNLAPHMECVCCAEGWRKSVNVGCLDSRNMPVDSATGKITGAIDIEFDNAMPAQFAHDLPQWVHQTLPG